MKREEITKARQIQLSKICLVHGKFIYVDRETDELRRAIWIYDLMRSLSPLRQDRYRASVAVQDDSTKDVSAHIYKGIAACARGGHQVNAGYFCNYQMSPYIELFTRKFEEDMFAGIGGWKGTEQKLKDFVDDLREQAATNSFMKRIENFEDCPLQNALSVEHYLRALHASHGTLTFVRLELGCHMPIKGDGSIQSGSRVSVKSMVKSVLKTVSNMESKIGYVWKLNYLSESSFRVQLFLIFKGIETAEMIGSANQIGLQWVNESVLQHAKYLNCNELHDRHLKTLTLGWGTAFRDHKQNEEEILLFFKNMFRRDRYLKLKIDGFRKTFSKGK